MENLQTLRSIITGILLIAGVATTGAVIAAESGTVYVDSSQPGTSFELKGEGNIYRTGTTPAVFEGMPPVLYEVYYGKKRGCEAHRPQKRVLPAGGVIRFFADTECGMTMVTKQQTPNPDGPEPATSAIRLVHTSNMSETIPGGSVRFTLSVRNVSANILSDITLTNQFNPNVAEIDGVSGGGKVSGNMTTWKLPQLLPGETKTFTYRMIASEELEAGQELIMLARVSGLDLEQMDANELAAITQVGIAVLPQTGEGMDMLLLLCSIMGGLLFTISTIRTKRFVALTV